MTSSDSDDYQALLGIIRARLTQVESPSPEIIRELINKYRIIHPVDDHGAERLARHFEAAHQVAMDVGSVLTDGNFEPWLDGKRARIDPYYWSRYKQLLFSLNLNNNVVSSLDEVTDRVLGLLEDPGKAGIWDRRGMVVGHVQSGKTANYTGLICKAADAGYKLIIVIAGIHNNLRNQTQERIDEGFVGRESNHSTGAPGARIIGVGLFDNQRRPATFTTAKRDFNQATAEAVGVSIGNMAEPAVLVIKKNSTTLKNLTKWLRDHNTSPGSKKIDVPMLLIDDEADNASINIRANMDEVARINGQIRELINTFNRSCYVGYTATPFANIFIDPDTDDAMFRSDLFPENFIVSLDPPTNYFGPTKVFLEDSKRFIRHIDDNEDDDLADALLPTKHGKEFVPSDLPESLRMAIRCFVLTRATRIARGEITAHNSMLINVSRFTGVQNRLRDVVHSYMETLKAAVRIRGALPFSESCHDPSIEALYGTWCEEYSLGAEDWGEIYPNLHEALAPIRVVSVNADSSGSLNYRDHGRNGLNVIAVGGYSLSRGLTLEGLSISYFLRNSIMYDTLLQMGRWFGYRPGYEDLCRVWMTEEVEGWYSHIAEAVEELRSDLRKMEQAGATPREFGLKVRSHPDMLLVTARNRMGAGQLMRVRIGLSNKFVETAILRGAPAALEQNREAAREFANRLRDLGFTPERAEKRGGGFLYRSVPPEPVIGFLEGFSNHRASLLTDPAPIVKYIEERTSVELREWDVLIVGVLNAPEDRGRSHIFGSEIVCQQRTAGNRFEENQTIPITNKQRVASRGLEQTGLTEEQIKVAKAEFDLEPAAIAKIREGKEPNYPDRIFRAVRTRPLLMVHILEITHPKDGSVVASEAIAWGISFPATEVDEERAEYMVNEIFLREYFQIDRDAQDEEDDD